MLRILKIFDGDYPWDVRVEKLLGTLMSAGHECCLLARNKQGRTRRERLGELEIRRLRHVPRLETLTSFPAFFHPHWLLAARAAAREWKPDRILVRDLPLAPLGLWLAGRVGCPVIVDMAEPYPEGLRSNWQFDNLGGIDHLVRNPRLADWVERRVCRRGPRVLVVSDEAGQRLERVGLPADRWTLVGNTPDVEATRAAAAAGTPHAFAGLEGKRILLFTGILVGDRGLDLAVQALPEILGRHPDVALVVVGDGPAKPAIEAEIERLGLGEHVRLAGWVDHADLPAHWGAATIGLLPFKFCTHIDTTLANKLFDYMSVGLPIVGSDGRPMKRVLESSGAGWTFRSDDVEALAATVSRLLADHDALAGMRERGLAAAEREYDWKLDEVRLLEAVANP